LIIIMCFLAACLVVFTSVMYWVSSSSFVTAQNNQFNMSEAAAEAATEKVLSQMNCLRRPKSLEQRGLLRQHIYSHYEQQSGELAHPICL